MVLLSLLQKERTYSFCGTIEYMAPEIIRGKTGHGKVNIWQWGSKASEEVAIFILVAIFEDLYSHCSVIM